jgi:hypothetical protein
MAIDAIVVNQPWSTLSGENPETLMHYKSTRAIGALVVHLGAREFPPT